MKGTTHSIFGMGFVGYLLTIINAPFVVWVIFSFILSPIISRVPDYDQKISRITFNQVVPHRGKVTHNLVYGVPIIGFFFFSDFEIIQYALIAGFGPLFAHSLLDSFNSGGVWLGFFHVSLGKVRWDSFWGNVIFKLMGIILICLSLITFL
ncbi:MAG: metal-dependent hydrolase [Candidatus Hodarchaeales archaeon]|jgi:membrane-bound metal-dependent hydrolase YbcI (DUF457 family)